MDRDWVLKNCTQLQIVKAVRGYTYLHTYGRWPEEGVPEAVQMFVSYIKGLGGSIGATNSTIEVHFLRAIIATSNRFGVLTEVPENEA